MTCDFEVHKRNMSCARCEETLPTDMWGATLNLRHYFPVTMSNTATVVSTRVLLRMSTMATHAVSMNKAAKVEAEARVPIPEVELEALRAVIVVTLAGDDDDDKSPRVSLSPENVWQAPAWPQARSCDGRFGGEDSGANTAVRASRYSVPPGRRVPRMSPVRCR